MVGGTKSKTKTTLNLGNILKSPSKEEQKKEDKNGITTKKDVPVSEEKLRMVWSEFAESRKSQMAEYHLLKQEFSFEKNIVSLMLTNPIEEPLLASIKPDLMTYLREKLNNNSLQVQGIMQEVQTRRIVYTNKEKFEHLAEKNPLIKELRDRLGLDPDF